MEENLRVILRKIRKITYASIDYFLPTITNRSYLGYVLYYSKGTGLVDRLRFLSPNPIYEEHICSKIVSALDASKNKNFFDIGANIGLVSLYIHSKRPEVTIYCFEPGIHQRALLELTAFHNSIEDKLRIYPYAVSSKKGTTTFATNTETYAVGGDGFLDTNRSPHDTKLIPVDTITLDTFCIEKNVIPGVIKIDIEGAELWALQGMKETLLKHKPIVLFEMHLKNIAVYPYSVTDILNFFREVDYTITASTGELCTEENIAANLYKDDMFVATPNN